MKIAVVSDIHDNIENFKKAVLIMKEENIDLVFHCGDHVAPFSLDPLKELNKKVYAVLGNNDGEVLGLSYKYANLGFIAKPPKIYEVFSKKVMLLHEPLFVEDLLFSQCNSDLMNKWLSKKDISLLFFGHTHRPFFFTESKCFSEIEYSKIYRFSYPLVLNPGALRGRVLNILPHPASFCIVDLDNKKLKFIKI